MTRWLPVVLFFAGSIAFAGVTIAPGDLALRHDIQLLADYGVIAGPTTTWPLAWGPVFADIRQYEANQKIRPDIADAIARVSARGEWETRTGELRFRARIAVAEGPSAIRSFQDTPREDAELSGGLSWIGERFSIDLVATGVNDPLDGEEFRADGSQVAVALGNWTAAVNVLDRWWGPGLDGSLILSNNARPIPALSIDRNFTNAFKSKWLSWLGPWDLSVHFGQMEEERTIPNTRFFGMRFNFRPIPSLEIGLSRTAQWCGDGRPCDFDTFLDLLLGKDNIGDDGIDESNEPGNQLAGVDFRWSFSIGQQPFALYGQFIGEDEAGGFPSRFIGQFGAEGSGYIHDRWSYRWYAEVSATTCDFVKSNEIYDCAYNHAIYADGYRYYGRVIGHAADNDARVATIGVVLVNERENSWQGYIRSGTLNRAGSVNSANSLTNRPRDVLNIELIHNRRIRYGRIEIGVGYDRYGSNSTISSSNRVRAFIQWRTDR